MPSAEEARELYGLQALRQVAGLAPEQRLHPCPEAPAPGGALGGRGAAPAPRQQRLFFRQAEALDALRQLVESGEYDASQVNLFAEEVGESGQRRFMVDTFAGFAHDRSPGYSLGGSFQGFRQPSWAESGYDAARRADDPRHLYEVILPDRPCWLYFDLEFSRVTNRDLDPERAMDAFRLVLAAWCADVLGASPANVVELDSSTPKKFSKHVFVKELSTGGGQVELALANNAQAGLLVGELIAYARARRHEPGSPCALLFAEAPPSAAAEGRRPDDAREVSLIDESVYSRNRCFRLLFQKKYGKEAALQQSLGDARAAFGGRSPYPPLQLLHSLASFVPRGTRLFGHALIPPGFGHSELRVTTARCGAGGPDGGNGVERQVTEDSGLTPLLDYLSNQWDSVRRLNEPAATAAARAQPAAAAKSVVEAGGYLLVTLSGNRFCFCKGASHNSNNIYLVVDREKAVFWQKCYDPDCRGFRAPQMPVPDWLVDSPEETALLASVPVPAPCQPAQARAQAQHAEQESRAQEAGCQDALAADSEGAGGYQKRRAGEDLATSGPEMRGSAEGSVLDREDPGAGPLGVKRPRSSAAAVRGG